MRGKKGDYISLRFGGEMPARKPAVELPLSKSIALRVMTLNAVCKARGLPEAKVSALPDSDDIKGMSRALRVYDTQLTASKINDSLSVPHIVNIGEGGAPLRFFIALAASTPGVDVTLTGSRSLRRRPLKPLIDVLKRAGADIRCLHRDGSLPLRIVGRHLSPGELILDPSVSSQFISALMMASLLWDGGLTLRYEKGMPVSESYITMTARIMRQYGANVLISEDGVSVTLDKLSAPERYAIEPDWSAASYFFEMALIMPGEEVVLKALTPPALSVQGDSACGAIFSELGGRTIYHADGSASLCMAAENLRNQFIELEMNRRPDLVPALAVGFALAGIRFRFKGISHLHYKESDRIQALINEMQRIGYVLTTDGHSLEWSGITSPREENPLIRTYHDHRIAMAFAPAVLKLGAIRIENPSVVNKSYPGYWVAMRDSGIEEIDNIELSSSQKLAYIRLRKIFEGFFLWSKGV